MAQAAGDKVTLGYWRLRGAHRGNGARYLLAYCGAQWENKIIEIGGAEWPALKSGGTIEFPNLPYITDGDFTITESVAVHRYICDKYKPELLGTTP